MGIQAVILAAGKGKRMHSAVPKVLHPLAAKPLIEHVIQTVNEISSDKKPIVIYGHQGEQIKQRLQQHALNWVEQKEQLGTGHALLQALPKIDDKDQVLILYGDVPLISAATLKKLIDTTPNKAVGMLTAELKNPTGYGRIKRSRQKVVDIVEEKDANKAERAITEVNTGIYVVPGKLLKKWLPKLKNKNAQGEYYLTDIISLAVKEKIPVHTINPADVEEILGVNDRVQLMQLERYFQWQQAEKLMRAGVTILDPARLDIRGNVKIGKDVVVDVNVILEGNVTIGDGCIIGSNTFIRNAMLHDRVEIKPNTVIEDANIGAESIIGPFARIRPGSVLSEAVHIGNFVEIKNTQIASGSKVNHLSYIGDSEVGARVNIGAGTITCNYDGANKHKTTIQDDVHIGSDTQLVAPVTIGKGATIAAGSTITKDVPPLQLTLSHKLMQRSVDWTRPKKKGEEK